MIWQAMAEEGSVSDPFVTDCTVNGQIYLNECIIKRFLPFAKEKKGQRPILFWPDLAAAHYAKPVTARLDDEKINYVIKLEKSPKIPYYAR